MREHDRHVAATQKDFANQHARAAAMGEHEALVAIGRRKPWKSTFTHTPGQRSRNARGERTAVGQPRTIAACGGGCGLPVGVAGDVIHGGREL